MTDTPFATALAALVPTVGERGEAAPLIRTGREVYAGGTLAQLLLVPAMLTYRGTDGLLHYPQATPGDVVTLAERQVERLRALGAVGDPDMVEAPEQPASAPAPSTTAPATAVVAGASLAPVPALNTGATLSLAATPTGTTTATAPVVATPTVVTPDPVMSPAPTGDEVMYTDEQLDDLGAGELIELLTTHPELRPRIAATEERRSPSRRRSGVLAALAAAGA